MTQTTKRRDSAAPTKRRSTAAPTKKQRLPTAVYSVLGPVPVSTTEPTQSDSLGTSYFDRRRIVLRPDVSPATLWHTLGHEIMHFILWDGGQTPGLSDQAQEGICDAFGTWFAAAVRAGTITLSSSHTP